MNFLIIMLTWLFIYYTAKIDASHISKGQYFKDHRDRFIQRACFFAVIGVYDWQIGIASALLFTVMFDVVINILLQAPLLYLGKTAKWDKFFRKRMWLYILLKITALIISVYIFVNASPENM